MDDKRADCEIYQMKVPIRFDCNFYIEDPVLDFSPPIQNEDESI